MEKMSLEKILNNLTDFKTLVQDDGFFIAIVDDKFMVDLDRAIEIVKSLIEIEAKKRE